MRTIKASEVVKGMRVRWEDKYSDATVTTEGLVSAATTGPAFAHIDLGSARQVGRSIDKDHPVTVLAEPEPEWVEGAWYWTQTKHAAGPTLRMRSGGFWRAAGQTTNEYHLVTKDLTVLGRVLIVDWPGDDVARELKDWPANNALMTAIDDAAAKVADAIRTQGGVR